MLADPMKPRRDADRTRARIVDAARQEFSRSGFAGGRISDIARRAGVNTSLIFYYFQNKAGLYRAVSERRLATYAPPQRDVSPTREDVLDWPAWLFRLGDETESAVRVVLREGIGAEHSRPRLIEEHRRRESFQAQVARVRTLQQSGALTSDFDAEHLTLLLYMLGVYPYMLPQSAQLITGAGPDDAAFRSSFETFAREIALVLAGTDQPADEAPARRSATRRTTRSNST
jgi:TetR/AcrR family transcriptional regulator